MIKQCKECGRDMWTKWDRKKFCSGECRKRYSEAHPTNVSMLTICWRCANTNDSCPWHSEAHLPVDGWNATESKVKMEVCNGIARYTRSYIVHKCPKFRAWER